jgi:hypothetical protein
MELVPEIQRDDLTYEVTRGKLPRRGSHKYAADQVRELILYWSAHPKIITYTRQCIALSNLPDKRGYPTGDAIMGALFAAQKKKLAFVRDPLGSELMASPVALLCLDPDGLCLLGGDCDDQLIALGACGLSAGVPLKLDVRRYQGQLAAHITLLYDAGMMGQGPWKGIDPSLESGAVSPAPFVEQRLIDVGTLADEETMPFIGLAGPPGELGLGDPVRGALECPRCAGTDFALVSREYEDGSRATFYQCRNCTHVIERKMPVDAQTTTDTAGGELAGDGLGAGALPALPSDQQAAWAAYAAALSDHLNQSIADFESVAQNFADVRSALGLPANDAPDPNSNPAETPLQRYLTGIAQNGTGAWTADAQKGRDALLQAMKFAAQALSEGISGVRTLAIDPNTGELNVAAQPGDPFRLVMGTDTAGNRIPVMLDPSGSEIGGLGIAPILLGIIVVAVAAVAIVGTIKIADAIMDGHHADVAQKIADFNKTAIEHGASPEQIAAVDAATGAATRALTPPSSGSTLDTILRWGFLLGGIALGLALGFGVARLFPRFGPARAQSPRRRSHAAKGYVVIGHGNAGPWSDDASRWSAATPT